ncbi:hypothetical protein H8356DRAFT_644889 [Neocallimastix lanati (nom. inval.)]|nr:hypothetical protein H8356DRAFT_644889 [Neocallimastix sp. JGI-2020a]
MRVFSKILSIFSATSVLAFSLENNKVKRDTQEQCLLGVAEFDNCFNNADVNQLCSEYNSERCQNFIANPTVAVPACQSLSQEEQAKIMSDVYSKVIVNAGIAAVSCGKNENGEYCSSAATESISDNEKFVKAINDSAASKACTDNATWVLKYMLSDGSNVNDSNIKNTLSEQCLKEIAEHQSKCFQGNDVDQLCGNYNSSECQTYLANPMETFLSCNVLPEEEQKKIKSDSFSNIILDAGVAAVSCAKNEEGAFCSNVAAEELSSAQKLTKAIEDSASSKACTDNAIWALEYMIADGENANNTNQEMTQIVNEGLKKLQDKKASNPSQQCLDDIAQYQSKCFQGNDVDQLCGNYNSSECQTYLANPISVLSSCQSLPEEEQKKIKSDSFSNIILDAGVAAVSCAKNEEGAFCSNVAAEELSSAQKLTKAIEDSASSKACTDNAIWALEYMIADGENANNTNQEMTQIVNEGLKKLQDKKASNPSQQCLDDIAQYQSKCFQEEEQKKIKSDSFSNIILDAGVAAVSCAKNEEGAFCSNVAAEELSSAQKLTKAIEDSASSKACTDNAIWALEYMIADGENANNTNQEMTQIVKNGLESLKNNNDEVSDNDDAEEVDANIEVDSAEDSAEEATQAEN